MELVTIYIKKKNTIFGKVITPNL